MVLALVPRLPTLAQPLLEAHGFRQTWTAYTALIYHEQGIDLLHPEMPIFGPRFFDGIPCDGGLRRLDLGGYPLSRRAHLAPAPSRHRCGLARCSRETHDGPLLRASDRPLPRGG